ncbi:mitogen-activated protein kinase 17 isoform X2 [Senna tora]|uniref:Mitogen-activated protein kinase 17 isoform X2 n=1 Tax=Senna tora TaxID=362788 RepID=A0A834TN41_9FABA|nr:mitogen-activated protein kinase 17 isoform X2 [Senna tora]
MLFHFPIITPKLTGQFYNRERVCVAKEEETDIKESCKDNNTASGIKATLQNSPRSLSVKQLEDACRNSLTIQNNCCKSAYNGHRLIKSASISASRCVGVQKPRGRNDCACTSR